MTPWRGHALKWHVEVRRCNRTPPLHHLLLNRTYLWVLNCQWSPSAVWETENIPTMALDTTWYFICKKTCKTFLCIRVHLKVRLCNDVARLGFFPEEALTWEDESISFSSAQGRWNGNSMPLKWHQYYYVVCSHLHFSLQKKYVKFRRNLKPSLKLFTKRNREVGGF